MNFKMQNKTKNLILFCFVSFLFSLFSGYLIWLQTSKYGVDLSPDSTFYLRWAETISKDGFTFIINNPSSTFPPLYPALLSLVSAPFNIDILIAARWFNIVLVSLFSFLSLVLCRKLTKNIIMIFIFGLFIAFSQPINSVFCFAWSETLFIFILMLITFSIAKTTYKNLILCGFLTSLAILTRYAGVAIVPAVCLYIFSQKNGLSEKVKKCFCYASIPTLTYIVYIVRNYLFTGTFMGHRSPSNTGFISNFDRVLLTVIPWFIKSYYFLVILVCVFLGAFIWNHKKEFINKLANASNIVKFSFSFCFTYSFFIILSSTTTAYDLINDRLMSPIFLHALILIFSFLHFSHSLQNKDNLLKILLISIFVVCSIFTFNATRKDIQFRKFNGSRGYNSAPWQENELLNYLKNQKNIFSGTIYSNDIYAFFLIDRNIKATMIPSKKYRNSNVFTGVTLENLSVKNPNFEHSYLVYFNGKDRPELFSLDELKNVCEMEEILLTKDGSIFKVGLCHK